MYNVTHEVPWLKVFLDNFRILFKYIYLQSIYPIHQECEDEEEEVMIIVKNVYFSTFNYCLTYYNTHDTGILTMQSFHI